MTKCNRLSGKTVGFVIKFYDIVQKVNRTPGKECLPHRAAGVKKIIQKAHFWVRKAIASSGVMRTCSMLSLSRTVTVPSSSVVKSTVRQ